jgi:DNA-binding MarR family transcriptional regulator
MNAVVSPYSKRFLAEFLPLPTTPAVEFLVNLFEARREILLCLDPGILDTHGSGLAIEEFEFLLAIDMLGQQTDGRVPRFRLQEELGISAATVSRRIVCLAKGGWLEGSESNSTLKLSGDGRNRWSHLMNRLSVLSENWLDDIGENHQTNQFPLNIHQKVLTELKSSPHLAQLRKRNPGNHSQKQAFTTPQHQTANINALGIVLSILSTGQRLSILCDDLSTRNGFTLQEADILVVLALYLNEEIKQNRNLEYPTAISNQLGLDPYHSITRYLVHSHRMDQSVFSRIIKRLSDSDGDGGLIQACSWAGRSKAARVTEKGYAVAERLWMDYVELADQLLAGIPLDQLRTGISIQTKILENAGRAISTSSPGVDAIESIEPIPWKRNTQRDQGHSYRGRDRSSEQYAHDNVRTIESTKLRSFHRDPAEQRAAGSVQELSGANERLTRNSSRPLTRTGPLSRSEYYHETPKGDDPFEPSNLDTTQSKWQTGEDFFSVNLKNNHVRQELQRLTREDKLLLLTYLLEDQLSLATRVKAEAGGVRA